VLKDGGVLRPSPTLPREKFFIPCPCSPPNLALITVLDASRPDARFLPHPFDYLTILVCTWLGGRCIFACRAAPSSSASYFRCLQARIFLSATSSFFSMVFCSSVPTSSNFSYSSYLPEWGPLFRSYFSLREDRRIARNKASPPLSSTCDFYMMTAGC